MYTYNDLMADLRRMKTADRKQPVQIGLASGVARATVLRKISDAPDAGNDPFVIDTVA